MIATPVDPFRKILGPFAVALLAGLMFIGVWQYLAEPVAAIALPYSTSRPEAFVLDGAMRLAGGGGAVPACFGISDHYPCL